MKAVVFNLGCKVNQYECDVISEKLAFEGVEVTQELTYADVYIINTCAVTGEAERKSRQAIARCKSYNPNAKIYIIGCASQASPTQFEKERVMYIGGSFEKLKVVDTVLSGEMHYFIDIQPTKYEEMSLTVPHRTRAFVKIQDGCNHFCTYCIIPYLRGRSRSRQLDSIIKEVKILAPQTKEIVLTGIDVMNYGSDIGTDLPSLFNALKEINVRIRLSSIYAEKITEKLLDSLFSLKNFCPHFHLSLQSGDDHVLQTMNRHYTADEYLRKIELIRQYNKNAGITTDVIVGFPTETEKAFRNTCRFVREASFSDLHIFPFSMRKGTNAEKMTPLPPDVIKDRKKILSDIKKELKNNFIEKNIGIKQEVLLEESINDLQVGYSKNYVKIYTKQKGDVVTVIPQSKYKDGLMEV